MVGRNRNLKEVDIKLKPTSPTSEDDNNMDVNNNANNRLTVQYENSGKPS